MSFQSGGQGLWSTVDDYGAFATALLDNGASRGVQLLRPASLAQLRTDQLTAAQREAATLFGMPLFAGHGYGLGVAVVRDPAAADPMRGGGGVGTLGWPGAYGSWWQADPTNETVLVFFCHVMAELEQLAMGIGLGGWAAVSGFHAAATARAG